MAFPPRLPLLWPSITRAKKGSRPSIPRTVVAATVFLIVAYLLWLPIAYLHNSLQRRFHHPVAFVLEPEEESVCHVKTLSYVSLELVPWSALPVVATVESRKQVYTSHLGQRLNKCRPFAAQELVFLKLSVVEEDTDLMSHT
jgi:hypothetical protein